MRIQTQYDLLSHETRQALEGYSGQGYGLIRGFLSADTVEELDRESNRLWQAYQGTGPGNLRLGIRKDSSGAHVVDRIDPVADVSEVFDALNRDRNLVAIAETALGGPVAVMKEKLIYKRPGTSGFGAHRDGPYTAPKSGVPGGAVLTVSLAIDPAPLASGPTEFFPTLRTRQTRAPADEPRDVDERDLEGVPSCMPETNPGDATLFDGQIPHRSDWNRSDRPRRIYMITYVPARYPDARRAYYAARRMEEGRTRRSVVGGPVFFS